MSALLNNAPELSVSELSSALKRTIEDAYGQVRLRGEISGYRGPVASGHVYFALKDATARIDAVIWKGVFSRLRVRPEEGLEVIATGRITTFPGKSTYQIVIEALEPAGVGALMALLEERKKRLAAEGLFDTARKRPLPFIPEVIGVITSPTGAVIRDILHRLSDRFPRRVIVWPVRVQGETTAEEVAAAIEGFNAIPSDGAIPRPDVLIVARGGGSLEDLWGFNEEVVVRAAAASRIPLVSAVGHETDTTLIDFASDMRAPTPTAAAELVVPVRADLAARLNTLGGRLGTATMRAQEQRRTELRSAARALPSPEALMAGPRQRADVAGLKLAGAMRAALERRNAALVRMARVLAAQTPQARLARFGERLAALGLRHRRAARVAMDIRRRALTTTGTAFQAALGARVTLERQTIGRRRDRVAALVLRLVAVGQVIPSARRRELARLDGLLGAMSYRNVLSRGFALVRDGDGRPLRSVGSTGPGDAVQIEFMDGTARATIDGGMSDPRRPARKPRSGGDQGQLF